MRSCRSRNCEACGGLRQFGSWKSSSRSDQEGIQVVVRLVETIECGANECVDSVQTVYGTNGLVDRIPFQRGT